MFIKTSSCFPRESVVLAVKLDGTGRSNRLTMTAESPRA